MWGRGASREHLAMSWDPSWLEVHVGLDWPGTPPPARMGVARGWELARPLLDSCSFLVTSHLGSGHRRKAGRHNERAELSQVSGGPRDCPVPVRA